MTHDKSKVKEDFKLHRYNKSGECIVDGHGTHCPKKSSEAGFTPGPWTILPQNGAGPMIVHEFETGSQMNPTGYRLIASALQRGSSLNEDKANATLIASAPELLECLKELYESSVNKMSNYETVKLNERVKQAISKAEGRA